jgi:peptide/nickel transport system substrate-binding protein
VAIGEEAESLDPPTSMLFTSEIYQQHLFDTLVGIEGDDFKPVGLLAEKWETVNPTTWRFHLRKGVKFHNGKALEAEDVKYSIEQYTDQKNRRSVYARGIVRAEVKDANTVDIVTTEPVAAMLFNVTRLQILPRDARKKAGAQSFGQQPIGTGPTVRRVEARPAARPRGEPAYWRGAVSPKRLVSAPSATRAPGPPSSGARRRHHRTAAGARSSTCWTRGRPRCARQGRRIFIYPFDVSRAPFDNRKIREASNLAVNKDAIVKSVLGTRRGARRPADVGVARLRSLGEAVPVRPRPAPSSSWPRPAIRRAWTRRGRSRPACS